MKKRKGFTIMEVLVALILLGLASAFFTTVYTHSYKLDRVNKGTITTSYQGQEVIEDSITLTAGIAQDYADYILSGAAVPPAGVILPQSSISMWGSPVLGYDVREVMVDKDADRSAAIDIYSFVYANSRRPAIPRTTFVTPLSKNVAPKFKYLEEYENDSRKYDFAVQIENIGSVRRAVTREYIGNKNIEFEGNVYVSRPYSDFFSGDNLLDEKTFYHAPYIAKYPVGYSLLSKEQDASKGKVVMDAEGNILDTVTNLSYESSYDITNKESYRDVEVVHTFQAQAVSGYTEDEKAISDSAIWLIGTPIIKDLVAQWDANLVYKKIDLDALESVNREIRSHTSNTNIVEVVSDENTQTRLNSVTELLKKPETISLGVINDPRLLIRGVDGSQFTEPDAPYRKYSAGIELRSSNSLSPRLKIQDVGKTSLGNGRGDYSIIIRAKQIDPTKKSNLFSINMNEKGEIENYTHQNNEANQFYIFNNELTYIADRGSRIKDLSLRLHKTPSTPLHNSVYNNFASSDERAGYHVYELQLKNMGREDFYRMILIVDGRKLYSANGAQPEWSDLDSFGVDIGSNLEVSDILVYSRELELGESSQMARYLLNKYTVTDEERAAIKTNLDAIG